MILSVHTDKCKGLILSGIPMLIGGIATFNQCSESGEVINSFFIDCGFSIPLSIFVHSIFLIGFIVAWLGLLLIFFGFFGYLFGLND